MELRTRKTARVGDARRKAADSHERKNAASSLHYFSDRLGDKLAQLRRSHAVVVEAPSGYGKTTAVRHGLDASFLHGDTVRWITFVEEAPVAAYERLCRQIGKIDASAGERLIGLGFPNVFTIGEVCDILMDIEAGGDTWLVMDNFHCLCASLPAAFLGALLERGRGGLRVALVTQMLEREYMGAVAARGILHITASDLRLDAEDIRRYYALAGVKITATESQSVLRYTAGWIIAIYLQLCMYRETGDFSDLTVFRLMEQLIWDKLTDVQQDFLLRVSLFDTIDDWQICSLLGCAGVPEYAKKCLSNPFVRHDPTGRRYELHETLFSLLAHKRAERGAAFERDCLLGAGDLCRGDGRTAEAVALYQAASDYERLLSLDFSGLIFAKIGNRTFFDIALEISRNCPPEIGAKYPLSMLRVAWALKSAGKDGEFGALLDRLEPALSGDDPLRGEWLLLSAHRWSPDLDRMLALVREAAALLGETRSRVILSGNPWCSGQYFQFSDFHTIIGEVDREADALERFIADYARLTGGHGLGADALFRSEIAYYRGDVDKAEIFAYKAAVLAESRGQIIIQLGAAKMLADISLSKSDTAGWQDAIAAMERVAASANPDVFFVNLVLDIIRGAVLSELQAQDRIADWLKDGSFVNKSLPIPVVDNAMYVHILFLLQKGEFARSIGTMDALPEKVTGKTAFSEAVDSLFKALGHGIMGNRDAAIVFLRRAAERWLPDGLILPLAMSSFSLGGLAEELLEREYPEYVGRFNRIKERFGVGWQVLRDAFFRDELPSDLTAREREIAGLAAEGLHNGEIASRLFVSENTVRAHMRTIFQKLDIDRRAKLAEKLG